MEEEKQDVKMEESSPSEDEKVEESSTSEEEQQQEEKVEEEKEPEKKEEKLDRFDKHPRFQEVIRERNELRETVQSLEERFKSLENALSEEPSTKEELEEKGLDPEMGKFVEKLINKRLQKEVGPLVTTLRKMEVDKNVESFKNSHSDYDDLEDLMIDALHSLSKDMQVRVASDPNALELLYAKAKLKKANEEVKKAEEKGRKEGRLQRQEKMEGGSLKGKTAVPKLKGTYTSSEIDKMSLKEYNDAMIDERLAKGEIRIVEG